MEALKDVITVTQAAAILGIAGGNVRRLIRDGRLPATLMGKTYLIRRADLKLVRNRKPGRPRKKA